MDDVKIRIGVLDRVVRRFHGSKGKLPANLKTLVDEKIISSKSLVDPWGKEFQFDGTKLKIWTETKDKKIIRN